MFWKAWHTVGSRRAQPPPTPMEKIPAHCCLYTPGTPGAAVFGSSEVTRLFQVMDGTIASTRRS